MQTTYVLLRSQKINNCIPDDKSTLQTIKQGLLLFIWWSEKCHFIKVTFQQRPKESKERPRGDPVLNTGVVTKTVIIITCSLP